MAQVTLNKLVKVFEKMEVVHGIDVAIGDGEFVVLVGPSGCGKSTLLRMIAGLESISAGDIAIGGKVVNTVPPRDRDIAMVFQNYALYPHMTVHENMAFSLKLRGADKAVIQQRVKQAADILDLTEHLERKPANLSGGQRQRVAMGRAIVRDPKAFLMDEPLSNLDAKLRVQMRTEISRIQQQLETTTIYVTHDQTEAMTLGDRIAVMRAGVLQQVGPPSELYGHPTNLFVAGFIGSPSMNFLAGEISGDHVHLPIGDVRIPDELRHRLESAAGGGRRGIVAGLRPEHFEDAALVADRSNGTTFKAKIDVLESMGSEFYAYFVVASEEVSSTELAELAEDIGGADLPRAPGGVQVTARLGAENQVQQGQEAELWFDARHLQLFDQESGRSLLAKNGAQTSTRPAPPTPAASDTQPA